MQLTPFGTRTAAGLLVAVVVAACGGGAPTPVPTAAPASQAPVVTNEPLATRVSTGPPSVKAAAEAPAGSSIPVEWTGPNEQGDFVTLVKVGTTIWTDEDYFYTTEGSPASLNAPSIAGAYEIWYVSGADKTKILARQAITLTAFAGSLTAADSVGANTEFEVGWSGPNGTGDYVTIVKAGSTQWVNEDYFYTTEGSPGKLLAPVEAGAYELWYVIGTDRTIQARRPITVTAATATLSAPESVLRATTFDVAWTGPNGPGDYVTIVAVGSEPNVYGQYFSTSTGSPGQLLAPADSGTYEIRYVAGQADVVFATILIDVK